MEIMMKEKKCLVIAEAGVNHNGRLDLAYKLCDAAKFAGADVVKFQTWKTENIITNNVAQAEYQKNNTGINESQFDMLKKLELSYEDFRNIKLYCDQIGLIFTSTADDKESLDFLIDLGVPFIKIGSGDVGNLSYLRYIGSKKVPVILSTGMSGIDEIKESVEELLNAGASDLTLLHCTTSYPCRYEDVNLLAMNTLNEKFGLPVGYSDHTLGSEVAVAAVALGAQVIEKHLTLDTNMEGPDHIASTSPDDFKKMVDKIRNVEKSMGTGVKQATNEEISISKVVRKRIVAIKPISKGEIFTDENISVKRNNSGIVANKWFDVIGRKAGRDYSIDQGIEY